MRSPRAPSNATSGPSGSASTSSSSPSTQSRYPYAEDGRIPAPPGSGLLEPMVTLTYLAARTSTVRLGTAMLLLPQRNPVYVAKEVSTLDWLSGGRVDLGVGVGWLKEEFDALNTPWPNRGRRTDEYLEVLRTLWIDDMSEFKGETFDLPACEMFPKPIQDPHPPIHIGGETPAALRRAAQREPGLAHVQPQPGAARRGAGRARPASRGRRAQPRRPAHHGVPVLQRADARRRRALRRGRRRRGRGALLRLHPRRRGPGLRRPRGAAGRWPPASAADRRAAGAGAWHPDSAGSGPGFGASGPRRPIGGRTRPQRPAGDGRKRLRAARGALRTRGGMRPLPRAARRHCHVEPKSAGGRGTNRPQE